MNTYLRLLSLLGVLSMVWSTPAQIQAAPKTPAPKAPAPKTPAAKTPAKPKPTPTRPRPVPRVTPHTTAPVEAPIPTATPVPIPTATPVPPAPVPTPTPEPPKSRTWALLIGISKYQSPQISSLRFPATDAAGIRDALKDRDLGSVPEDQIHLLTDEDATAANINNAVDEFLKPKVQPGDQVVVFLAGHGVSKGVGAEAKSYLLPTDAKGLSSAALETSAIDLRKLSDKLGQLKASQFVVFVDACREDPSPGRGIKGNQMSDVMSRGMVITPQEDQPTRAVTVFACSVGQRAFEDPRLKHGVFTYWILDGLRQGAVALKEDGSVRMGFLATYVRDKVQQWAATTSQSGDFEVEQTPEAVVEGNLPGPIVLMHVKRPVAREPITPAKPQITVSTIPEDAQVTVNGKKVRAGAVTELDGAGDVQIEVEAPGYKPRTSSIKVREGYAFHVSMHLAGNSAIDYELLANVQRHQGNLPGAIQTLITLVNIEPSVHSYSLLSQAYAKYWERATALESADKKGNRKRSTLKSDVNFIVPTSAADAAFLSLGAVKQAINRNSAAAEAQLALGFALVANDDKGKNKNTALAAFTKARDADPNNAANHFGLGYGIRFFANQGKEGAGRTAELNRAIEPLKKAVELKPVYFEAQRELAYCYFQLGNNEAALRHCEMANACRADASDKDDVASVNVAMAGIHQQKADQTQDPKKKKDHQDASSAYIKDAQETSRNQTLDVALGFLRGAGLSTQLGTYLPPEFHRVMNFDPKAEIRNQIPSLPGGIRIPGF